MGILSTFDHTISVKNGVNGLPLKDKLLADGVIIQNNKGEYEFSVSRLGATGILCNDMESGFSSKDGNTISVFFTSTGDNIKVQYEGAEALSRLYPDTVFNSHASYCPGGGSRVTAFDRYVTGGKETDALGRRCEASVAIPAKWISGKDPNNMANTLIKGFSGTTYSVNSQNIDAFQDITDWTKVYTRDLSISSRKLIDALSSEVGSYERYLDDMEYRMLAGLDEEDIPSPIADSFDETYGGDKEFGGN